MNTPHLTVETNPIYWTTDFMVEQGRELIHSLATNAAGTLVAYRLVLGRCLLAAERTRLYEDFGCSGAIHYAVNVLGVDKKEANTARRVARRLEELPRLRQAAEQATIDWSKLREVVSKASFDTEPLWLELCHTRSAPEIEELVSKTPRGGVPGDLKRTGVSPELTQIQCQLTPEAQVIVERGLVSLSQEAGRKVDLAEALEFLFAGQLAERPVDAERLEKMRQEARKDLAAQERVHSRAVRQARELAARLGLLQQPVEGTEECPTWDDIRGEQLWRAAVAAAEKPCPEHQGMSLVSRGQAPHWENQRVEFNPEARATTPAQKRLLKRRDCYRCSTPNCPNHVWLEAHHITFYCEGGLTVPENICILCSHCHANVHRGHLKIEGTAPDELTFLDGRGRPLVRDQGLEVAGWIDFWLGWKGGQSFRQRYIQDLERHQREMVARRARRRSWRRWSRG